MRKSERSRISNEVSRVLEESKAVLRNGHFIGTSGNHLDTYVNKNVVTKDPRAVARIGKLFARLFADKDVEVVVGPATAAIVLAHETAESLSKRYKKKVEAMYTDKEGDAQVLKRGYDVDVKGKRVLVVEDIVTTGGSLKSAVDAVLKAGGTVVGASAIVNRNPKQVTQETFGVPFDPLLSLTLNSYKEGEVPESLLKIPINITVGHGKAYLEKNKKT